MEYTQDQLAEFKREFAARRKRQLMIAISFVLAIIAFALLARFETDGGKIGDVSPVFFFPIFFAVVIGALAFSFRNWRCPACGRYLGREMSPRFCSKCGVALQ